MKTILHSLKLQRGVASLLTAIVLLICITLVVLFTAKTILTETKITADDYRTSQATAAAQAAMDRATAYVGTGSMDHDGDSTPDFTTPTTAQLPNAASCAIPAGTPASAETLASSGQSTIELYYFVNTPTYDHDNDATTAAITNPCCVAGDATCLATAPLDTGLIVAKGWSDDCTAVRTISQCLGSVKILNATGPEQPFVTHGSIGIAGNATFINRYTNSNIWTGGALDSSGAAFATYLRPASTQFSDLSLIQLNAGCPNPCDPGTASNNVRLVSNTKAGYGVDVIGNDPSLGNLTPTEFFAMFFGANTKADIKSMANDQGQLYSDPAQANGKTGLIWVEGSGSAPNTIGTPDLLTTTPATAKPAILIVNGDLTIGANSVLHGFIYVTGTLTVNGGPEIYGSIVSESGITSGNGNPKIIFVPMGGYGNPPPPSIPTRLSGSWKDW
jgi:hypothetical protein